MSTWDPDEIDELRHRSVEDTRREGELRRIDLKRERTEVARRNMRALGALSGKVFRHATEPALGFVERLSQGAPWAALGAAAGGSLFLLYLALRRRPTPQIVVVRDEKPRSGRRRRAP